MLEQKDIELLREMFGNMLEENNAKLEAKLRKVISEEIRHSESLILDELDRLQSNLEKRVARPEELIA